MEGIIKAMEKHRNLILEAERHIAFEKAVYRGECPFQYVALRQQEFIIGEFLF